MIARVGAALAIAVLTTLPAHLTRLAAADGIIATPRATLPVETYRLANGLEVILAPDPSVQSVVVHVWYHVGSKDEVAGKTGFAHLFEHLMFKGSAHVADGAFDTLLEGAGGWNNGTTNSDRTTFFEQLPAASLALALYLEADRMAGLWAAMSQSVLDNQRAVVLNERRQSYENRPYGMAGLAVQQALWPQGHGNYNLTIGTQADLDAASLADVEAFWRAYYRPSNATLVIAGGFAPADGHALVDRYFAWMPLQPRPTTRALERAVEPRDTASDLRAEDAVQASKVMVAFRTDVPLSAAANDLELAGRILGGGKSSRLYRRLVMIDRLATDVRVDVEDALLGGQFTIHATVRDGVDATAVRTAIADELARLRERPVTDDELTRARTGAEAELLTALEGLAFRAEMLATWSVYAGKADDLDGVRAGWRAVTPATLQASARRWLADSAAVTMTVRPRAKDAAPGAAMGAKP